MFRAFIDTCVWFDLAQDSRRFPEIGAIEQMVRSGALELLVPQLAVEEFYRWREDKAISTSIALRPHINQIKAYVAKSEMPPRKTTTLLQLLDELVDHSSLEGGTASQALDRIERLLTSSPHVETSEAARTAAMRRGIEKRAPFLDSNGMADALLFETYAECVRRIGDAKFLFVTHNKSDFSDLRGDHNQPHPHLADSFVPGKSSYFIDLKVALREVAPQILIDAQSRVQPTVRDIIETYLQENSDAGPTCRGVLQKISGMPIASRQATKLKPSDFLEHLRGRRKTVAASTATHDMTWLKNALIWAHQHMGEDVPVDYLERARRSALSEGLLERYTEAPVRRLSPQDERRLMDELAKRNDSRSAKINMVDVVQFALWSARRRDEICRLRWEDFNRDASTCKVRDVWRKGNTETFPLLGDALEVVLRRHKNKENSELIFPYNSKSVGAAFTIVKERLEIEFTFDELREEGLRRLLEARQHPFALIQKLDPKKVLELHEKLETAGLR